MGPLDHLPARILRQLLIDKGWATQPSAGGAWPAFVPNEPKEPEDLILVTNQEGLDQGRRQNDGRHLHLHGFQILVRCGDHGTGENKASTLAVSLDESVGNDVTTVEGSTYLIGTICRNGGVLDLGRNRDVDERYRFTINGYVTVRQTN